MKRIINWTHLIIFLLLSCACSSKSRVTDQVENDSIEEEIVRPVDSIAVNSLQIIDKWYNNDSVTVKLSNPYNDTLTLDDEYFIYEEDSDSLLLRGKHPKVVMVPDSSASFNVGIGLDSIWYWKFKTYLFVFPGRTKDRDVIYYDRSIRKFGYHNRENGREVGIPDAIR